LSFSLAQIVHYVYGRNFCVKLNFELNSEHSPQFVGAKAEIPLIRDCGGASTKKKGFCGSEKNRGKAEWPSPGGFCQPTYSRYQNHVIIQ